jgi:hypothetical protein
MFRTNLLKGKLLIPVCLLVERVKGKWTGPLLGPSCRWNTVIFCRQLEAEFIREAGEHRMPERRLLPLCGEAGSLYLPLLLGFKMLLELDTPSV